MSIHVVCGNCRTGYDVNEDLRGKKIRCRSCDEPIPVRAAASGIKAGKAQPSKAARPARRHEEEDDEEETRPRKKKAKANEEPNNNTVLLLVGGLLALFLVGGIIFVVAMVLRKDKDADGTPLTNQPVAQATTQPVTKPVTPPVTKPVTPPVTKPADSPAETQDPVPAGRSSSEKVYERVCQSTVLILSAMKSGNQMGIAQGSGTLIDKTNRLVLTNDHVINGTQGLAVFFQAFSNGKRIADLRYFMEQFKEAKAKTEVPQGKVVFTDKRVDLALIQVDKLPPNVKALPIAEKSPAVTNSVLSVGHPKGIAGGGLWVHTAGEIRQFQQRKQWRAGTAEQFSDHEADVILTNSQTNPGDSGGPLVNMRAQLVGVTQGGVGNANALSIFIDLPEIRKLLKAYQEKSGVKLDLETQPGVGGDASSLPKLLADLSSNETQVRARATLALGDLGPDAQTAIPALFKALKDRDETVARQAAKSLRAIGAPSRDDIPMLIEGLRDTNMRVSGYAVEALGKMGPEGRSAVSALTKILKAKESDTELRQQAARSLGQIGVTQGVTPLSEVLKDPEATVREAAAEALGKFAAQAKSAIPALLAALEDTETNVRRAALASLAQIGPGAQETLPKLKPAFKDADALVRRNALDLLGRLGAEVGKDKEAMAALKAALDDLDLAKSALTALTRIGPPAKEVAKDLAKYLKNEKLRLDAVVTLGSLLGKVKANPAEARNLRPVLDELINLFEVEDLELRLKAIETLGKIGSIAVTPLYQALQKATRNNLPNTRFGVIRALGSIGRDARRKDVVLGLTQLSKGDPNPMIRDACIKALQRIQ